MNGELLRLVDSLHRDKGIDKEVLLKGIEDALVSAVRRHYPNSKSLKITIDRTNGQIVAHDENGPLEASFLGRISAHTAKQVILQKIKEAESDVIHAEMVKKQGELVTGSVNRMEHGTVIVNLGKAEGNLPKDEQVPGEIYRIGERIKALLLYARKDGALVNIILSRSHPNFIRRFFELEVPEIADKTVEIKAIAREAGFRTKIAVASSNSKVDAVGSCVGIRGARIKNIMEEVYGEKIDIIKWDETPEIFIKNAMKPAEVEAVEIIPDVRKARVFVSPDQLSLAIGKRGQNIRLVCRLTQWDIDVVTTEEEQTKAVEAEIKESASKASQDVAAVSELPEEKTTETAEEKPVETEVAKPAETMNPPESDTPKETK